MSDEEHKGSVPNNDSTVEEVLGSEVIADAERRAKRIRDRGQRDAERIRKRGEVDARKAAEDILTEANRRAELVKSQVLATLEVEKMKVELAAKEELISSCLRSAWEALLQKGSYDYASVLVELAVTAIARMRGDRFVIQLGEADRERVNNGLLDRIRSGLEARGGRPVEVRPAGDFSRAAGGCVVLSADGGLRYDNSFAARRDRLTPQLRRLAARELFGTEEGEL